MKGTVFKCEICTKDFTDPRKDLPPKPSDAIVVCGECVPIAEKLGYAENQEYKLPTQFKTTDYVGDVTVKLKPRRNGDGPLYVPIYKCGAAKPVDYVKDKSYDEIPEDTSDEVYVDII
jgi:hypothetical protein